MESTYPYRRIALAVLAGFFVWGGISYYWYACGIKNLCAVAKTTPATVVTETVTTVEPTPVTTKIVYEHTVCDPYITHPVGAHTRNNPEDVSLVEQFLSVYRGEDIVIDGEYSSEDIAGIKRFQAEQNIPSTGNVFAQTAGAINTLVCAQ